MLEGFQYRSISGWSANAGLLAAVLTRGHSCLQECLQLFSGSLAQCWLADPPQMLLLQVAAQPGDRVFDPQHPALFRRRMHQDRRTPGSSLQCPPVAIPAVCRSACRSSRTTRHGAGSAIGSSRRLPDVDTANGKRRAARCSAHRWPYLPSAGVPAGIPWLPRRWPVRGSTAAAAANTFLVNGKLKRNPTTGLSIGSRKSMLLWTL